MKEYQKCAREMLEFIEESPSCFHAVENIKRICKEGLICQSITFYYVEKKK